jgi:hypothetical protein
VDHCEIFHLDRLNGIPEANILRLTTRSVLSPARHYVGVLRRLVALRLGVLPLCAAECFLCRIDGESLAAEVFLDR